MKNVIAAGFAFLCIVNLARSQAIDSLENLLGQPIDDSLRTEVLIKLGFRYGFSNYDKALEIARQAQDMAEQHSYREMMARNSMSIGVIHFLSRKYDSAIVYYQKSSDLALENGDSLLMAKNLNNIGLIHLNQARYKLALENIQRSNTIHTLINFEKGMANTLNNIGTIYQRTEQYDLAIEAFKRGLQLALKAENKIGEASCYVNIGAAFLRADQFDSAAYYQRLAIKLNEEQGDKSGMSIALRNLADVAFKMEDYATAKTRYEQSLELRKELGGGRAGPVSALGITYAHLGDFTKAREFLNSAIALAEKQKDPWEKSEALLRLSRVYEMQNDLRRSLDYYRQHISIKDSLLDTEKSNQLFELQTLYDTERKNGEIAALASSNEIQALQLSQSQQQRNLFIGFSIVAFLLVSFLVYSQRQKQKANVALRKANEEKETLLKEIHHRVKNNLQIVSSLLNLQAGSLEDEVAIDAVKEGQNRVKSMALIHENLYQNDNLSGIDVDDYIENLTSTLYRSFGVDEEKIKSQLSIEKLKLDIDTLIPLGLILNELLSNSLKYAFPNGEGNLVLSLNQVGDTINLKVKDDGPGLDEKSLDNSNSYGWKMIKSLSRKLKADISIQNESGTEILLIIKNYQLVA